MQQCVIIRSVGLAFFAMTPPSPCVEEGCCDQLSGLDLKPQSDRASTTNNGLPGSISLVNAGK